MPVSMGATVSFEVDALCFLRKLFLVALLAALLFASQARGGASVPLEVLVAAAQSGTYGLRVTPNLDACVSPQDVTVPAGNATGAFEACSTLTTHSSGVTVVNPGAVFTAGDRVIFNDQFQVNSDAPFKAEINRNLTPFAYVQDNSPQDEQTYNASLYLKIDSLNFGNDTDRLHHFVGYSGDGTPQFRVVLRLNSGEKRLVLEARKDNGQFESTEGVNELELLPGYNKIQIVWKAASGTGELTAEINDSKNPDGLSNLDNDTGRIDHIKWGAISGTIGAVTGNMDLDEFSSWR